MSVTLRTLLFSTKVFNCFSWSSYPLGAPRGSSLFLPSTEGGKTELEDWPARTPALRGMWQAFPVGSSVLALERWVCAGCRNVQGETGGTQSPQPRSHGHRSPGRRTRWSREHVEGIVVNMQEVQQNQALGAWGFLEALTFLLAVRTLPRGARW